MHSTMSGSFPSRSISPVIASCQGRVSMSRMHFLTDEYLEIAIDGGSQRPGLETNNSPVNFELLAFALDQKIGVLSSSEHPIKWSAKCEEISVGGQTMQ